MTVPPFPPDGPASPQRRVSQSVSNRQQWSASVSVTGVTSNGGSVTNDKPQLVRAEVVGASEARGVAGVHLFAQDFKDGAGYRTQCNVHNAGLQSLLTFRVSVRILVSRLRGRGRRQRTAPKDSSSFGGLPRHSTPRPPTRFPGSRRARWTRAPNSGAPDWGVGGLSASGTHQRIHGATPLPWMVPRKDRRIPEYTQDRELSTKSAPTFPFFRGHR